MSVLKQLVLGIDVGTTTTKATAFDPDGVVIGTASAPTRWDISDFGQVQTDADRLADDAIAVLNAAARSCPDGWVVAGIGITGMAETGVLVDERYRPIMPAIAWYDERGKSELAALPQNFQSEFSAVTGLAFKAECSFAKLLWRSTQGHVIPATATWLNALEYVAYRLTGIAATEPSLASRTGLLDQSTVQGWDGTLSLIGSSASLLPPIVSAGTALGHANQAAPHSLRGAAITVAGHDHLVGAVGAGAAGSSDLYDSCGTADVILRSVPRTLTNDERGLLVERGLSAGRHVIAGSTAILGATRSGLVLGRVLSMLGAHDRAARRAIADAWDQSAELVSVVGVSEPPAWTNEVTIALRDDAAPADVWSAAMQYVLGATTSLVHAVDDIAGPYANAIAAGGWAQLDGVLRGKASIMPGLQRSSAQEPGTRGAALFAAAAAGITHGALATEISGNINTTHKELIP